MREMLRWLWTQITSMRTALLLLFLLALTAIPGSFIPQDSTPIKVSDFAARHSLLNRIYKPLGFYHVYTSPWFSAVYLLLFVSLIGCILPRIGVYVRALRTPPPRMPSRLDRLPENARLEVSDADAPRVVDAAQAWLRSHHFRTVRRDSGEVLGLSAEKGYLREFGNLLFHVSMLFVLVSVAISNLYGYKGTAQVVVGQGFSNTITQYDQFSSGARVDSDRLNPFTVVLKSFTVRFETGAVQTGAARAFDAVTQVTADGRTQTRPLSVNHPLTIDGTKVHLLGHGYAAHVTVKDGAGNVALSGPVTCQPLDSQFRSMCVINVPDARPSRVAFQGFFLPTGVIDPEKGPVSIFPDALNPALYLTAWSGAPRKETGIPQNVFTLDTTGMTQLQVGAAGSADKLRLELRPGQTTTLPNHLGSITFDGWSRWANLQVSRNPGLWPLMSSIALAVIGLCLSLFMRPRRLWIRVRPLGNGSMLVEAGGLDRADARTGLADEVRQLVSASTGVQPEAVPVRSRGWTPEESPAGIGVPDALEGGAHVAGREPVAAPDRADTGSNAGHRTGVDAPATGTQEEKNA